MLLFLLKYYKNPIYLYSGENYKYNYKYKMKIQPKKYIKNRTVGHTFHWHGMLYGN